MIHIEWIAAAVPGKYVAHFDDARVRGIIGQEKVTMSERDEIPDYLDRLDSWLDDASSGGCAIDLLKDLGVMVPESGKLSDEEITEALNRVVMGLGEIGFFLHSTDHLSDRELYEILETAVREPALLIPEDTAYAYHYDILGGCSEEDLEIHYTYYADDEERARSLASFPDDPLPPRKPRPFDRDRSLPKAEDRQRSREMPDA